MSKQDPQILDVQQYSDQTTFLKTLQETTEDCRVESPMHETNREDFAGDFFSSGTGQTNLIFPVQ
ncbi:MAG: hypothetical protein P8L68_02495 [Paracoccaceae bacterium]|nr:hypothetical protein [Paracoccaceae bacterium]